MMDCLLSVLYLAAGMWMNTDLGIRWIDYDLLHEFTANIEAHEIRDIWTDDGKGYGYFDTDDNTECVFSWYGRTKGVYGNPSKRLMIQFYASDDHAYLLAYSNVKPFADANGEHWGIHPCAAVEIDYDYYAFLRDNMLIYDEE